ALGIATAAIDLPFHGSRAPSPRDTINNVTLQPCTSTGTPCDYIGDSQSLTAPVKFFNLGGDIGVMQYDPRSPRDNMRQAAADNMQLLRGLTAPGNLAAITTDPNAPSSITFRSDAAAYIGFSFGTFPGALIAATDP